LNNQIGFDLFRIRYSWESDSPGSTQ